MNLFVADPEWGWWIVGYFFLGGIAAGCYFVATFLDLVGHEEDRPLARLGYRIAFPLVIICGILLIADLNRPERFWHMLIQSEQAPAPMFKPWSPMSIGAWALFVFGGFSFVSCLTSVWPAGRIAGLLEARWLRWPWRLAGSGVGFFVASYTGVLLTATNQPLWSQTDWLGPLFLCSSASTALATLVLLGTRHLSGATHERLQRAETIVLCLELVVFAIFIASLTPWINTIVAVPLVRRVIAAAAILGMILPVCVRIGWHDLALRRPLLPAAAILAGGLLLRYGIVSAAPAILEHQRELAAATGASQIATPESWLFVSPEDRRERGGGPGASALNRPDPLEPRSKVLHELP